MNLTRIFRLSLLLICFVVFVSNTVQAQKNYFVYLQSENKQPFYVNIGGKNVSSAPIGYLILSKLVDTIYPIRIGFPGKDETHDFYLHVDGADKGFVIKDFGEKGYGLFNLQSLEVVMNSQELRQQRDIVAEAAAKAAAEKRVADSLNMLAARRAEIKRQEDSMREARLSQEAQTVMTDSTKEAISPTPTATETPASEPATDSKSSSTTAAIPVIAGAVITPVAAASAKKENDPPVQETAEANPATVAVISQPTNVVTDVKPSSSNDSAFYNKRLMLEDSNTTNTSTSTPVSSASTKQAEAPANNSIPAAAPPAESPIVADASGTVATEKSAPVVVAAPVVAGTTTKPASKTDPKFLDMEMSSQSAGYITMNEPKSNDSGSAEKKSTPSAIPAGTVVTDQQPGKLVSNNSNARVVTQESSTSSATVISNNCPDVASEKDFFNLRKKMASSNDNQSMIDLAKKAFKEKCYSTEQIHNLCVLFLDDEGKYNFLDEAYSHATDPANYRSLGSMIKDDYFLRRFNAMLR